MRLGPMEIVLILVVILVVFGVGKLPQVGSALGKSIRAFKEGESGEDEEEVKKPRRKQARRTTRKAKVKAETETEAGQDDGEGTAKEEIQT